MIYHVKLYIFTDIRFLIFIIAFKNMAAAALCCGSLLCYDVIAGDFFICPYFLGV